VAYSSIFSTCVSIEDFFGITEAEFEGWVRLI
jgi:hypothetical protein